jgi:hypothetical protein
MILLMYRFINRLVGLLINVFLLAFNVKNRWIGLIVVIVNFGVDYKG